MTFNPTARALLALLVALLAALALSGAVLSQAAPSNAYTGVMVHPSFLAFVLALAVSMVSGTAALLLAARQEALSGCVGAVIGCLREVIPPAFYQLGWMPDSHSSGYWLARRFVDFVEFPGTAVYSLLHGGAYLHWATGLTNPPTAYAIRSVALLMLYNSALYAAAFFGTCRLVTVLSGRAGSRIEAEQ